jgi:enterochelin esterase-like enzyme
VGLLKIVITTAALFLVSVHGLISTSASTPTPTLKCDESGTIKTNKVPFLDRGELHTITVFSPPCYAEDSTVGYPVLYWTAAGGQDMFDTSTRLIGHGVIPPFIFVMIGIDPAKGYGADEEIINYVVPFIDAHYHTQPDRLHRSITGISHGAAIAVRTAFRSPATFSRIAVLSGGISETEVAKFTDWITAMPDDQRLAVLVDVGDQDGITIITRNLTGLFDKLKYPYTFTHAPGDHNSGYWGQHIEAYLKWLMPRR